MRRTYGERLREARTAKGLYLREVAAMLGISVAYVSEMERNRRNPPKGELRARIVDLFGVDVERCETCGQEVSHG